MKVTLRTQDLSETLRRSSGRDIYLKISGREVGGKSKLFPVCTLLILVHLMYKSQKQARSRSMLQKFPEEEMHVEQSAQHTGRK